MDAPDSPTIAADHTLRALHLHALRRDGCSSPSRSDTGSDDDRGMQSYQQARHYEHYPLAPPSPKLSLQWILEQRNLLPLRRVTNTPPNSSLDSVAHSPLPSLRFASRSPQAVVDYQPAVPVYQERSIGDGGLDHHAVARTSYRKSGDVQGYFPQNDELFVPHERQYSSRSMPLAVHDHPQPMPLNPPQLRDSSNSSHSAAGTGHSRRRTMTPEERRIARTCTVEGCSNYIVDRHRCFRHGVGNDAAT